MKRKGMPQTALRYAIEKMPEEEKEGDGEMSESAFP
jgi:hypothetical protein